MDLSVGDRVFYTRSNGLQLPATVVGTAEDGLLHLEYYQEDSPDWTVYNKKFQGQAQNKLRYVSLHGMWFVTLLV